MTRLPVLNERPRTFELCQALGLGVHAMRGEQDVDADEAAETPDHGQEETPAEPPEVRPCPFVGCSDHLAWLAVGCASPLSLDADRLAAAIHALELLDLEQLPATCARRGPFSLEQIGALMGVTRERIRQIETAALKKTRHPTRSRSLRPMLNDGHDVSRPDLYDREEDARAASTSSSRRVSNSKQQTRDRVVTAVGRERTRDQWAVELGVTKAVIASRASAHKISFGAQVERMLQARERAAARTEQATLVDAPTPASPPERVDAAPPQHRPALRPKAATTKRQPNAGAKRAHTPTAAKRGVTASQIADEAAKAFAAIARRAERRGQRR